MVWGQSSTFGEDIGLGDGVAIPYLMVNVTQSFVAASGSPTLQISIQAAPDTVNTWAAGTYVTLASTQAFAVSQLTAGQSLLLPIPPRPPGMALPRYYQAYYTLGGSGTFNAGKVTTQIVINPTSLGTLNVYPINYVAV